MKTRYLLLALFASAWLGGGLAFAQSTKVPGPQDYDKFSGFITDRNIFDSTRQPHDFSDLPHRVKPRPDGRHHHAPAFTFVGAMMYSKGAFAFFNGNSDDLKKIAAPGQTIANGDYTVVAVSLTSVKLQSADKKQLFDLQVGDGMRQEDGKKWAIATAEDMAGASGGSAIDTSGRAADDSNSSGGAAAQPESNTPDATPSPAAQPNEILKRLMELRKQESQ